MKALSMLITSLIFLLYVIGCTQTSPEDVPLEQDDAEAEIAKIEPQIKEDEARNLLGQAYKVGASLSSINYISCSDSDEGKNFFTIKGTTKYNTSFGGRINSYTAEDQCYKDTRTGKVSNITLIEYYCINKTAYSYYLFNCVKGCKDGACIKMTEKPSPCAPYGDIDRDGLITSNDVIIFDPLNLRLTEEQKIRADVNFDLKADSADLSLISQYTKGRINTFPICSKQIAQQCQQLLDRINKSFGKGCNDKEYDHVADIDKNKFVNVLDISIVAQKSNDAVWCSTVILMSESPCLSNISFITSESAVIKKNDKFIITGNTLGVIGLEYIKSTRITSAADAFIKLKDLNFSTILTLPLIAQKNNKVSSINYGGVSYTVFNASSTNVNDFYIQVDLNGNGILGK